MDEDDDKECQGNEAMDEVMFDITMSSLVPTESLAIDSEQVPKDGATRGAPCICG